ncbi:cell growth regulator with RING finger domain protein 1-like [Physella acuta]|uniref:cell growth regulator with RING finger domain protein 1-like n=1 Tax=Physella acuta TaxID=109671 RepID=UPI0027DC9497|nr:cell growth regulator with RING finger domain protein 1-like [Physella acuta]
MGSMANPLLLWFAGYSNVTSIVVIILCFLAMTVFISLYRIDLNGQSVTKTGVEQTNMVKVCNPFFIRIEERSKKLADGIKLHLSSLCPGKVFVLWGAKINPVHDFMLKPGHHIRHELEYKQTEDYSSLDPLFCDTLELSTAGGHEINLPCPASVTSDVLGDMPRKRYPVTVFTVAPKCEDENVDDIEEDDKMNSVIGLISIIHLQDDKVVQKSNIIGNYVKTYGVQLYSLQPLFLSNDTKTEHPVTQVQDVAVVPDTTVVPDATGCADEADSVTTADLPASPDSTLQPSENPGHSKRNHSCLATEAASTAELEHTTGEHTHPECVVCQTRPVMCALLPCRHACVCLGCFKLLDKCPMCRSVLQSYFLLDECEEDESSLHDFQHQAINAHFDSLWERINLRLNAFFGFR